ncbi:ABC transporter ATP-binding protein [Massilia putida]|uniref:ABC transporter ATP-binding protein n=1 Tax=Massilia putida TaxID=1141883 RepID=UPI000953028F|nr:ABC transporter ATP-binding protein [Massilia putida]
MTDPILHCDRLCAGWGDTRGLSDVSITLSRGTVLAVLGRNGVGKSTLLSTVMGRATHKSGAIKFDGRNIERLPVYERAKLGIGFVPQEREIFPSLSVRENLLVAGKPARRVGAQPWSLERVIDLMPRLGERINNGGSQLSGGEQQMLSIGRALMGNPSVLLLDEPMEGLAPVIIDGLVAALHRLRAQSELAILLVEQHVSLALEFTDRIVVLDRGMTVYDNADGRAVPDRKHLDKLTGVSGH